MAELPIIQQQFAQQSNRASAADFGAIEAGAKQGLGKSLSSAGEALNIKKQADDLEEARRIGSETKIQITKDLLDLRNSAPLDGKGHTDAADALINDAWLKASEGFSGPASQYLIEAKQRSRESNINQEIKFEAGIKGTNRSNQEIKIHDEELNSIRANPTSVGLQDTIEDMTNRVEGYAHSASNPSGIPLVKVNELIESNTKDYQNTFIEGLITNVDNVPDAEQLKKEILSKDTQEKLRDTDFEQVLKQIDSRITSLNNDEKVKASVARSEMGDTISDYQAFRLSGNFGRRPTSISDANITAAFGENADDILQNLRRAETRSNELQVIGSGSAEDALSTLRNAESTLSVSDFKDNVATVNMLRQAFSSRQASLSKQGADYVTQNSETYKNMLADVNKLSETNPDVAKKTLPGLTEVLKQEQLRMGVSPVDIKVLTSGRISHFRDLFNKGMTTQGENIGDAIDELREETGKNFNLAVQNLVDAGAAPVGLGTVVTIEDPTQQSMMIEGIRDFKELTVDLKKDDYDTSSALQPLFDTMPASVYQGVSKEIGDITAAANGLSVMNLRSNVSDPISAASDAILSKFDIIGTLRIPAERTKNMSNVETAGTVNGFLNNFESDHSDKVNWEAVGSLFGLSPEQARTDFNSSMRSGKVGLFTSPDDTGVIMVSNTGAALPNLKGDPLVITWDDFFANTPNFREIKTLSEGNN